MANSLDMGHLVEGTVELDPVTGRHVVRTSGGVFDIQEVLAKYLGKTVRLTLADFDTLQRLADLIQNGAQVEGLGKLEG